MMRVCDYPKDSAPLTLQSPLENGQQLWSKLLAEIANGSQSALASLYQDTSSTVFGLILRIVGKRSTAEEVLLEVFQQVWREAECYPAQRLEPLNWLLKLARTRALACLRQRRGNPDIINPLNQTSHLETSRPEPQQAALIAERQSLARAAMASLPSCQRAVIELAYYRGLSQSEIASELGMTIEAVKTDVRLAMMKLREYLNPVLQEQL
jgi:RNA polymerase sigma factor (sigma-70 family)